MGFFDTEKGVEQYIQMTEGYDGAELINILQKYLTENSTVLELGNWTWKGHGYPEEIICSYRFR